MDAQAKLQEMIGVIESAKEDAEKFFERGNDSAGTRLRKAMQLITHDCKDLRGEVLNLRKSRKEERES